jgi:hypothetical protein
VQRLRLKREEQSKRRNKIGNLAKKLCHTGPQFYLLVFGLNATKRFHATFAIANKTCFSWRRVLETRTITQFAPSLLFYVRGVQMQTRLISITFQMQPHAKY